MNLSHYNKTDSLGCLQQKETRALMWILCEKITWLGVSRKETRWVARVKLSVKLNIIDGIASSSQDSTKLSVGVRDLGLTMPFDNCTCRKNHCFPPSACSVSFPSACSDLFQIAALCTAHCKNTPKVFLCLSPGSWNGVRGRFLPTLASMLSW